MHKSLIKRLCFMTKRSVVIDKDLLGWADNHREQLLKEYENIICVGRDAALPQRSSDEKIALHCKNENCDLLTADIEAYTCYFDVGVNTITIKRYDVERKSEKYIYLIKVAD